MEVTDAAFKGQFIEYTFLSKDGTTIRTISLNKNQEHAVGENVKVVVKWTSMS